MSGVSWSNFSRFARANWRESGLRALPEVALRGAMGAAWELTWRLGTEAPLPAKTVMVVGHQRSGTTYLHRMLASHPAASAMPLHALVFPADAVQRPLTVLPRPLWWERAQDAWMAGMDPLHRIRLHESEEDEFLLWSVFRSPMNALDRPWESPPEIAVDEAALALYAQAVARAVRRSGRRHVGKNPHFTYRIDILRRALPGVTVVALWRDPVEAIASRLSLIREIWRFRLPGFRQFAPEQVERIYQSSLRIYRGGLGAADLDVPYAKLVRDPVGVVRAVHEAFDLEPVEERWAATLSAGMRAGPSAHRYGLAEFGLSEARIRRDLAELYAARFFSHDEG